jgi:hypothetical protein
MSAARVRCVCAEPQCKKEFERLASRIAHGLRLGHTGPYCSRRCSSRHARKMQLEEVSIDGKNSHSSVDG